MQKPHCSIPNIHTTIYTTPLILYQLETVPVPVIDQNVRVHSYTHLQVAKPYIALNLRNVHLPTVARTKIVQKNWL